MIMTQILSVVPQLCPPPFGKEAKAGNHKEEERF
jgi:hypothetical protein